MSSFGLTIETFIMSQKERSTYFGIVIVPMLATSIILNGSLMIMAVHSGAGGQLHRDGMDLLGRPRREGL